MTITLYMNKSPANYVTKEITEVTQVTGFLRDAVNIVDPTIVIERTDPTGFNYVCIPDFKRYYFVTGVSSVNNKLVGVSMHVDVLMTYKAEIANMEAVVKRQENQYNLFLDDGIFRVYQNPKHKIMKFPNEMNDFSYILALAGNS